MSKMIFSDALKNTLNDEKSITENGAIGYKTSKSALVDFNFNASSFRNKDEQEIRDAFAEAYNENPLLAVKLLFMTGDIRQGMGERRTFRTCFKWLAEFHANDAKKVVSLIPEYSRWDILVDMLGTSVDTEAFGLLRNQLDTDTDNCLNGKPISLLAKWLPSVNTSSQTARKKARSICARLKLTERTYRKRLSQLRNYSNVVETKMSANNWDGIKYEAVPSKANLLYKEAFMKHDETRRTAYLDALEKGETKINSSASFPYEIVSRYHSYAEDATLEQMWKALPDYTNGKGENTICVVDGSGSMSSKIGGTSVSAEDVAQSLGIYFAEKMPGQFHNQYITFSERPQLVNFDNCDTLKSKIDEANRHCECENTNVKAVFELILRTAKKHKLSQSDMPKSILILSDMEFDSCVSFGDRTLYWMSEQDKLNACKTLFETIGDEYKTAGYELPKLVFWNIMSRTGTVPMQENKNGVVLVSGFSPTIASMVFSQKNSPYEVLVEKLNSKRYEPIEQALA
jgi:hypothetical protein